MAEWCNGSISESLSDDPSSSLGAASATMSCRVVMSLLNLHKRYHGFSHFKLPLARRRICDMWQEGAANAIPAKAHDLLANYERGEVKVSGELLVLPIYQNQLFRALSSTVLRASLINWYIRFNSLGAYMQLRFPCE